MTEPVELPVEEYIMPYSDFTNQISLTYRPHIRDFDKLYKDADYTNIEKMIHSLKYDKYILSLEKGSGDDYNHLQCVVYTNKSLRDFRKQFKRYMNKTFRYEINSVNTKTRLIKSNLAGVIGYCQKEEGKHFTTFDDDFLKYCDRVYKLHEKSSKNNYYRINNKNFHIHIEKYIEAHAILRKQDYSTEDIQSIIGQMANDKYFFTFLNKKNIIRVVAYTKHYLNHTMEEYITDLYNEAEKIEDYETKKMEFDEMTT